MSNPENSTKTAGPFVSTEATATPPKPEAPKTEPPAQAETDWKSEARKWEERAKENNKAAARLAEIEEANKTAEQRLADAKVTAEKERDDARKEVMRLRVATKFGIDGDDVELFLTGSDEDTLTKQAERLSSRSDERRKQGNHVPREGQISKPVEDDRRDFLRQLTGRD